MTGTLEVSASPDASGARTAPQGVGVAALGALGVVFGDIGTSPIYTVQTIFNPADPHPVVASPASVYGLLSLVFWSVTVIVTVLYVGLVLRADNRGEGGILSLITLLPGRATGSSKGNGRTGTVLATLGVFGASLFLADSMITPAISVLSAVEGLRVVQPELEPLVIPLTVVIIIALFTAQRFGTATVARFFGPIMALWFLSIGVAGAVGISGDPAILRALSPTYAVGYLVQHPASGFFALAAVVLAITGAEALYADLGHFGRRPISTAWLVLVYPACILSYFGQGASILSDPTAIRAPFFLLVPTWALLPMVLLATAATVIASQAVVTGAFSVARQAVQLGYLPRLRILHTSRQMIGQIYVPYINWGLMIAVIGLVLGFQSSAALAYAFGMAVTGTIIITTLLLFYLARTSWRWPWWRVLLLAGPMLVLEGLFLAANLTKLVHGAWLPLLIAVLIFTVLTTWQRGRAIVTARREGAEGPLEGFVDRLHDRQVDVQRVPGTAVFLNRGRATTPLALRANVEHNHILHECVVIAAVETVQVPTVDSAAAAVVDALEHRDDGITHVTIPVGYMQQADIPTILAAIPRDRFEATIDVQHASYFLSTIDLELADRGEPGPTPMPGWQQRIFLATAALTADAAEYFNLPRDRTVIIGSRIGL